MKALHGNRGNCDAILLTAVYSELWTMMILTL